MVFDLLWVDSQDYPHLVKIFPSETEDLHNRDVPLFTTHPGSQDVWSGSGQTIANVFNETGMSLVHRRLTSLSENDHHQQLWFIRASLATTAMGREPVRLPTRHRQQRQTKANHRNLLTHLGIVWHEPELLLEAKGITESLRDHIAHDRKFDLTSGSTGCIMSLLALYHATPCENTLATAIACGDHLLEHVQALQNGTAWPPYFPAKGPLVCIFSPSPGTTPSPKIDRLGLE